MPSTAELNAFLERSETIKRPHDDPQIVHLHRTTTGRKAWPNVFALAFDHRRQFAELVDAAHGDEKKIADFKRLLARTLMEMPPEHSGAIVDDRYGFDALTAMNGGGRWLARPVEIAGSRPLKFEAGHRLHDTLRTWPAEHVIKCLVSYSTKDATDIRAEQQGALTNLQEGVFATGHRWLLEVVPPEFQNEPGSVVEAVQDLYKLGLRPDWWKLPPLTEDNAWSEIAALIRKNDPQCGGVVVLGYDKPEQELFAAFESAIRSGHAVGFAVGRSVWREPATDWLSGRMDDATASNATRRSYENVLNAWLKLTR